jgi:hypothetical protein
MCVKCVTIGGISSPDSALAQKAAMLAEKAHTLPLLNHVHRTWWFAEFLGRKRGLSYDRELLYIASILHDLGLSPQHTADKRFEVDGADAASQFLQSHDYPEAKIKLVWDAIALHSAVDIADRREPEVALVYMGAHLDVMGLWIDEISNELIDDTLELYPRLGFKEAFTLALAENARRRPHKAIGTALADVARRLMPGLEIQHVCDIIHAAPFES